jgi:hypothetical protein
VLACTRRVLSALSTYNQTRFAQVLAIKTLAELDLFAILSSGLLARIQLLVALNVRHSTAGLTKNLQLAISESADAAVTNVEGLDARAYYVVGDTAQI